MFETIFCATLCACFGCIFGEKILDVFTVYKDTYKEPQRNEDFRVTKEDENVYI